MLLGWLILSEIPNSELRVKAFYQPSESCRTGTACAESAGGGNSLAARLRAPVYDVDRWLVMEAAVGAGAPVKRLCGSDAAAAALAAAAGHLAGRLQDDRASTQLLVLSVPYCLRFTKAGVSVQRLGN